MKCVPLILDPSGAVAQLPHFLLLLKQLVVGCWYFLLHLAAHDVTYLGPLLLAVSLARRPSHHHLGGEAFQHLLATTFLLHFLLRALVEKTRDVQWYQTECPKLQHLPCLGPPFQND